MKTYYLDHAATTPLDPWVLESMMPYLHDQYGNPSSMHQMGIDVKRAINDVRIAIASAFDTHDKGVIFTSGGTEATNLAIRGYAKKHPNKKVIITSTIEHHATVHTLDHMEQDGYIIRKINVDHEGFINLYQLKQAMDEHTLMVTLIGANNEIGTMQNIRLIGQLCHEHGIIFHVDGVQWVGHERLSMIHDHVDMLSISAHKFYGPKGIGALILREGLDLSPILYGGMQEKGLRSGTENVIGIIGLGKALDRVLSEMSVRRDHLITLSEILIASLQQSIPSCIINGPKDINRRLPGLISVSCPHVISHEFAYALDQRGVFVSTGSACLSNHIQPSHVLQAIGVKAHDGTLRLSLGKDTTENDIKEVVLIINDVYEQLKDHDEERST